MVRRVEKGETTVGFKPLRGRLEREKQRLLGELAQLKGSGEGFVTSAEVRNAGSSFVKREDEAAEMLEMETRLALERRIREQLAEIQHALDKFDQGNYGHCDSCGSPISMDRLEALPEARLCIACKAKQVRDGKFR